MPAKRGGEGPVKTAKQKRAAKRRKKAAAAAAEGGEAATVAEEEETAEQAAQAQAYLRVWKGDRAGWKFNKAIQTRLLKRYFKPELVPDELFPVFLEYMDSLKGLARERTVEQAKTLLAEHTQEEKGGEDEGEDEEQEKPVKYRRAEQLLQTLSASSS